MLLSLLCDLTDDVFNNYDYLCILPTWDCIIRVPSRIYFICSLTDSVRGTELKDCASRPKSQGVAVEAAELQGAKVLLPVGVEDGQGDTIEGNLGLQQVLSLKQAKLGYLWLAGNNLS